MLEYQSVALVPISKTKYYSSSRSVPDREPQQSEGHMYGATQRIRLVGVGGLLQQHQKSRAYFFFWGRSPASAWPITARWRTALLPVWIYSRRGSGKSPRLVQRERPQLLPLLLASTPWNKKKKIPIAPKTPHLLKLMYPASALFRHNLLLFHGGCGLDGPTGARLHESSRLPCGTSRSMNHYASPSPRPAPRKREGLLLGESRKKP
jgi:hypothetical protein